MIQPNLRMLFYFVHRISFYLPDRNDSRVGQATPRLFSTHRRWGSLVVLSDCIAKSSRFRPGVVTGLEKIRCRSASTTAATCGITDVAASMPAPDTDVRKDLSMCRLLNLGFSIALTSYATSLFDSASRTNFQFAFQLTETTGAPAHHATKSLW